MITIKNLTDSLSGVSELSVIWFILLAIGLMSTFVPKTLISILCGTLYPPLLGCILIVLIATTAAVINFLIGRFIKPKIDASTVAGRSAISLRDAGFGLHLLVRLSPVPSMMISYLCGALRCRFRPYVTAAAVAAATQWVWVIAASTTIDAIDSVAIDTTSIGHGEQIKWAFAIVAILAAIASSIIVARAAASRIDRAED